MPSSSIYLSEPLAEIKLLPGVILRNISLQKPHAAIRVFFFPCWPKSLCSFLSLSLVQVKLLSGHWWCWPLKDT